MTATAPDRDGQMLGELAEMDLSAAKHVHTRLLAATGADEVADLSRSYQRLSRGARQTLALKARLAQDAVVHRLRTTPTPAADLAAQRRKTLHEEARLDRITALQDAVGRLIYAEVSDATILADYIEGLDVELDDWMTEADFTTADLDAQVLRACRTLGLPEDLARRWRDLPEATDDLPPAGDGDGDDDSGETPPVADTG